MGNPFRAFHGSAHDFDTFDWRALDDEARFGHGLALTSDPEQADLYRRLKSGAATGNLRGGKVYEVEVDVDPRYLIDADKALSEQSPAVREFARLRGLSDREVGSTPGSYRKLVQGEDYERLIEYGIPGLRKLDTATKRFLREAGDAPGVDRTRDFHIYDPELVTILRKYGLAGLAGMGGLSAMGLGGEAEAAERNPFDDAFSQFSGGAANTMARGAPQVPTGLGDEPLRYEGDDLPDEVIEAYVRANPKAAEEGSHIEDLDALDDAARYYLGPHASGGVEKLAALLGVIGPQADMAGALNEGAQIGPNIAKGDIPAAIGNTGWGLLSALGFSEARPLARRPR
jgi:hypothetical protein